MCQRAYAMNTANAERPQLIYGLRGTVPGFVMRYRSEKEVG